MVERFERNKLYFNSNSRDKIVKCDYITSSGAALLTRVCKHPEFTETPGWRRSDPEILSSSPENWDEFALPEVPGLTKWVVSYMTTTSRRRVVHETLHDTEEAAIQFGAERPVTEEVRAARDYKTHPIIITQRQTLEQFVRSVEDNEETI
jgi:hypothetical protein